MWCPTLKSGTSLKNIGIKHDSQIWIWRTKTYLFSHFVKPQYIKVKCFSKCFTNESCRVLKASNQKTGASKIMFEMVFLFCFINCLLVLLCVANNPLYKSVLYYYNYYLTHLAKIRNFKKNIIIKPEDYQNIILMWRVMS